MFVTYCNCREKATKWHRDYEQLCVETHTQSIPQPDMVLVKSWCVSHLLRRNKDFMTLCLDFSQKRILTRKSLFSSQLFHSLGAA